LIFSTRAGAEGEKMSDQPRNLGARVLISIWLIAIVSGFFVSVVMSIMAFRNDAMTSGLVFGAIAIGCALLCYRTFVSRDELRSNFK
jgi:CHASE2 domain-containing sensor protein